MAKKWIGLALSLVLALGLVACTSSPSSSQPAAQSTAQGEPQAQASEPVTEEPEEPEEPEQPAASGNYGVGDTAEIEGLRITLLSVVENEGSQHFPPDEGNIYVVCEFLVENESDEEVRVSSALCFKAYVDDFSAGISLTATTGMDIDSLNGEVPSGKKIQGGVGYEVNEDWQTLEVSFSPSLTSKESVTFEYEK